MQHKKLLVIGGLPNREKKLGYGGATVLMQNFVDYLHSRAVNFKFIQTNKYFRQDGKPNGLLNKVYFLLRFIFLLPWCDVVMFNFSDHATVTMYPKLVKVAKILRKIVVFRKFGGSLDIYLSAKSDNVRYKTFKAIDMADLVLLETQHSIDFISQFVSPKKIIRFPNVRNKSDLSSDHIYKKEFVFISHILDEKGVGNILEVARELPKDYKISFFGPIMEKKYQNFDWESYNVKYGGVLNSDEVLKCLSRANILLLTSYREGQPGIIIEAMSVGVPCISTAVGGIPEMVVDGYNGILIAPGDKRALLDAIISFNQEKYKILRINALKVFEQEFEAENTNKRILNEISRLSLC